ncbi:MAG: trehalose synthase [Phycisphaerae bacterium]
MVKAAPRSDPLWYRNAVIYQLHVRSFSDSNADGVGDFNGLISRLDYLEELGVTAVWLLPFYPSPLKDDGYDTADYTAVHPTYGDIEDARRFIDEAHRRQIRVITELVINHTSDQHPWFQRARRAPRGSPERDFYVWSDTPERYAGVRIIFKDFESSNWSWDPVAKQYYWHRFYSHQPDLNFENPRVHEAVFQACDFWMRAGVDGMRLDAIPYLFEREGTSCENLPETHDFLRKLRAHVDERFRDRMLLAEANQWPEDAIAYFGEGDECHMAFHFPLMPRLFMALRMEDRFPVIDILDQTPDIPSTCQWALFLRNHDELTLEMVTDEERDYMYRVYATDQEARINLGIRRRLAPLLNNNRRKIELMNGLLFSLPGTPVLYYGDEIGMGDNIFLGDRDGVRTPMQWSGDRNAGFSRANPQRLYLPIIIDPEYHYETVNVESQIANPSSLLWWTRRLIALRKRYPVFGRGDIHFLTPSNSKVLAFLRRDEHHQVLVVANLSRFAQPVELDLSDHCGATPEEMFGKVRFPPVGEDGRYFLTLGPNGFYWFLLEPAAPPVSIEATGVPEVRIDAPGRTLLGEPAFERELKGQLPALLQQRRWFVSKARAIRDVEIQERIPLRADPRSPVQRTLFLIEVEFTEGEPEVYALPLAATPLDDWQAASAASGQETGVLMRLVDAEGAGWVIHDAMNDAEFPRQLLQSALRGREIPGQSSRLVGRRVGDRRISYRELFSLPVHLPEREQSNTNVVFGKRLIMKLYRRLGDGPNPELELGEHLTARARFPHTAPLTGTVEVARGRRHARTLAVFFEYVPNQGDAWSSFLDHAQRYFERLDSLMAEQMAELFLPQEADLNGDQESPSAIALLIGEPLELCRLLGRRTAEMHAALADDQGHSEFAPEPFTLAYQRSMLQSLRNTTRSTMRFLSQRLEKLNPDVQEMARTLLSREGDILIYFRKVTGRPLRAQRIRCHGDYHLGQVLWTGRDFVIIDFEGEPLRSFGERRIKRSPMRDVAGMVRSFDYAAWSALRRHRELLAHDTAAARDRDTTGAVIWGEWLGREYVRAYTERSNELRPDLLATESAPVLRTWLLEKALYEILYELNSRPDWVEIPLRAALMLLENARNEDRS